MLRGVFRFSLNYIWDELKNFSVVLSLSNLYHDSAGNVDSPTQSEQRTKLKYPHWKNIIKYEFVSYLIHSTLSSPLNFPQFFSLFFFYISPRSCSSTCKQFSLHFLSNRKCCLQKGKFITFKCVICDLYAKASSSLIFIAQRQHWIAENLWVRLSLSQWMLDRNISKHVSPFIINFKWLERKFSVI